jgi:hypothetical protein
MGTRTRGFVDLHLSNEIRSESGRVVSLLARATSACLEVEQYWRSADALREPNARDSWSVYKGAADDLNKRWFSGPGSMNVHFGLRVAMILCGARWRGFLTIPALRKVHRKAFLSIARELGATAIMFVPDYAEELAGAMDDGKSFDECLRLMESTWGPLQGDLDEISPRVIAECENCPPKVWYLEHL